MTTRLLAVLAVLVVAGGALTFFVLTRPAPGEAPTPATPSTAAPAGTVAAVEDASLYHEARIEYPKTTPLAASAGAEADAKAVATMKTWAEGVIKAFRKDNGIDSITPADVALLRLDDRKYALEATYEIHSSDETVSYVYRAYEDTLGAHPNAYYKTFTFSAATGAELSLTNLFDTSTNYLNALSTKAREKLVPQIAKLSDIKESEVDRGMLDPGTEPKAENFQWFYLDGNDLTLIFPPYSIGPWVLGVQEITLSKSSLSAYLKAEYK